MPQRRKSRASNELVPASGVTPTVEKLRDLADDFSQFMLHYKFGLAEVETKVKILAEELAHKGRGNPIEHVSPRLKTPASITAKRPGSAAR